MFKKILYPLLIGSGLGLTGTFLFTNFTIPVKIFGIILSLSILISGMILNYKINKSNTLYK